MVKQCLIICLYFNEEGIFLNTADIPIPGQPINYHLRLKQKTENRKQVKYYPVSRISLIRLATILS